MKSKMHENLLKLNNKAVSKKLKISSLKNLAYISFGLFLLTASCAQSGNKSKNQADTKVEAKTIIETPQMNIQTAILSDNLEAVEQHVKAGTDLPKYLLTPVQTYAQKTMMVPLLCTRPHFLVGLKLCKCF